MCIAYLAIAAHPQWPLLIAANRDEFHARPSLPAAPWPDRPDIISGIDLTGGGTWLGVTRRGRYALITNYRDPGNVQLDAPSRGMLVSTYLESDQDPRSYADEVQRTGDAYNGFNLIVGDIGTACYAGNRNGQNRAQILQAGRYVLSNHLLDTPWPKSTRLRQALQSWPGDGLAQSLTPLFTALRDTTPADDQDLPQTGLSLERERLLSSPFIISPDYGTRCSTIFAIHASGRAIFSELSYGPDGVPADRHDWPYILDAPAPVLP